MKINEVISKTKKVIDIQPQSVARQTRVNHVVAQIAASDQQQQPTEIDKVMATRQYANIKKQAQRNYLQQLRLQLANAQRQTV